MILKNHTTIDKLMLDTAKDRAEIIEYVTKNMERNLVEAMLDKIEPEKEYKIKLREREYYEDVNPYMCGYKMYIAMDEYGWIPCEERLPEDSGDYLVCPSDSVLADYSDFSDVMVMPYDETCEAFGWWTDRFDSVSLGYVGSDFNEFEVVAWMPLPEPYKEK